MKLLDHGYLELIEAWGSDESIIEAARMSTAKGFLGWGGAPCPDCEAAGRLSPSDRLFTTSYAAEAAKECKCAGKGVTIGDEKLLRFLWEHEHATPFEMAGATFEAKAPIMVFREWHRHRVPFGYNEMSARYVPLPDENYMPDRDELVVRSEAAAVTQNRQQAGTGKVITDSEADEWLAQLAHVYDQAQRVYELGLKLGVPKELARLPVPVARYSRMRATGNLRGWLGFLKLRAAPTAQKEIRVYAEGVQSLLADRFPRTLALFAEGRSP